ncbi:PREDICTED: protein inscuteable homolog [Diuraphis noxia]|uniref:protein inscuteable homolog n=1 Tax=Diuraphis noxia TaxID=143948 RepID=UPI0007639C1D|nr:PREDICTED: protein inscuteable homolog [Diuraphis noxia]
MSKNNMTDFQRTRSKVWFPNLDDDDEDIHHSWRRQPSSSPESRRISSGSPSNGSHKSQDSGFSDSESSPLGLSKALLKEDKQQKNTNAFTDQLPDGVLPEALVPRVPSPCEPQPQSPNHCNCFLPACELSRKFRSFEYVAVEETSPFRPTPKKYEEEPRTPNRTCFIVDELPKTSVVLLTPSSVKSFDGHFDQSENVTVVENIKQDCIKNNDLIIDPPTPFVDRFNDADTVSLCESDRPGSPEHTSTPKSTKNRCCTPRLHYRKDLQLRKPKHLKDSFNRIERENEVPVGQWLNELRFRCEPECMTTLQSKSIATSEDMCRFSTVICTDSEVVRDLYQRTKSISNEFIKVYNDLNKCPVDNFGSSVQTLTGMLLDFVCDHESQLPEDGQELCMDLVDVSEKLRIHANRRLGNRKIILNDVSALGQIFSELIDALLMKKIQSLVDILEEPSTDIELVKTMSSINSLGLESVHLGSLVTKCNGVRSLLTVCIEAASSVVRSAALRTLAMVCCSSDSIRQFEKAGGVEILSDVLGGKNRSEKELTDAVSVLAQITAPWIEDNHVVNGLSEYLDTIISSLTYLVETTQSSETLLLSSAALANITFMEPNAIWTILNMGTAGSLIEAVRKNGTKSSVFLQEQTATLLANMAAVPEARPHMAANHAVVALLCFLQVRHSPLQRVPEILAAERLQHKTAIALSRLCSDVEVSKQFVELEGVNRLIRLCKDERERNHSDGVLVACLASLRKIAANCGKEIMNQYDAAELIEPRLLDSFLLYSSKQESYV